MGKGDTYRPTRWDKWDNNYESIFGHSKPIGNVSIARGLKSEPSFYDNPKARETLKIGREINRFKKLDNPSSHEINSRFGKDADSLFEKKIDRNLVKNITIDVVKQLRRV